MFLHMNTKIGYIYVMENEAYDRNLVKIGYSDDHRRREKELYTTGTPGRFTTVFAVATTGVEEAESAIHERLSAYRVNPGREFFNCGAEVAIRCIRNVISNPLFEFFDERFKYRADNILNEEPSKEASTLFQAQTGGHTLSEVALSNEVALRLDEFVNQRIERVSSTPDQILRNYHWVIFDKEIEPLLPKSVSIKNGLLNQAKRYASERLEKCRDVFYSEWFFKFIASSDYKECNKIYMLGYKSYGEAARAFPLMDDDIWGAGEDNWQAAYESEERHHSMHKNIRESVRSEYKMIFELGWVDALNERKPRDFNV